MKNSLKLIVLSSIIMIGAILFTNEVRAESNLTLEVIEECNIKYSGDDCIIGIEIVSTGNKLIGDMTFHSDYKGTCSENIERPFDGNGIQVTYNNSIQDIWVNGDLNFIDIELPTGKSRSELKIKTHQALCPGRYDFNILLEVEEEETNQSGGSVSVSGGGITVEPDKEEPNNDVLLKEIIRLLKLIIEVVKKLLALKIK